MRLPSRNIFKWFLKNYGIGGVDNYTKEQIYLVIQALSNIEKACGYEEADWLGKFLIKLSNDSKKWEKFFDELELYSYL
jgi:hypothetical protein